MFIGRVCRAFLLPLVLVLLGFRGVWLFRRRCSEALGACLLDVFAEVTWRFFGCLLYLFFEGSERSVKETFWGRCFGWVGP